MCLQQLKHCVRPRDERNIPVYKNDTRGVRLKKKVLQLRIKYNINHFTKQRRGGGRKEEEGKN